MFDELDLGAKDYSGKGEGSGFEKFLSKPSPRPYQPFGGPMQQAYQPQPEPVDYSYGEAPVDQGPTFYDDLDAYEQLKNGHKQISQFSRENSKSAKRYEDLYGEFMDNEFKPFFESVGGFGDFESDDEYISAVDEIYKSNLKASQQEDGWLGASDEKTSALEGLKNFQQWDHPNGMRAKFLRLKAEKDKRREVADRAKDEEFKLFEQMTNISIPAREQLEEQLKSRNKAPGSTKKMNEMLDGMSWEQPVVGYDGEVQNLESVDPRAKINPAIGYDGQGNKSSKAQRERVAAAMRGDIKGVLSRRQHIAKERQLRDKGFFFSESGLLDGRPIGMSRRDVDLLDIDDMRKAGMTSFQGKPLDQAMTDLGGEERLEMAKVMQSVYSTKSNYEDAQLKFLKAAGSPKADKLRDAMEAAREDMQKTIGLAASYGLDNELFEQAETTGWLSAMGNAVQRGALMSEMSNYTPDFLTNTLDADEMQKFIEIASEIEKLPTSSTMKRVKETKSDGFLDAMGNLLFDNPAAIPEMFVESLSSFLPSTVKWLLPSAAAGAAAGTIVAPGAGTLAGAGIGARASWGVASFVLEASGMALEGMQELNIDWKNPKVFAAAWTNESIRSKIQKKMVQKGTPIAIADMLTGMMAGKVMGVVNHTGNAVFKGGKLLNKEAFNAANGAVPRFKLMQKTRNAAAELGADSFMGMSGEYLGQWASKEPGEDWDWDAIAAEGLVGVGPGAVGAALEMRGPRANYFGNAPIDITGETQTETGSTGTVNRAGYQANYQTFNDPESMMAHFEDVVPQGTTPEEQDRRAASLDFTRRWVDTMFKVRPEAMAGLKVVISDRTPDANLKNRGTFESRDGNNIIYLNEKEFAQDPMGAMLHESGHFARIMMLKDEELTKLWGGLKEGEQLDAYTQYYTKDYERSFEEHDEKTQKKIRRAFNKTDNEVLAEEWFSYQWARVLNSNYKPDKSVKGLEKFYSGLVRPLFAEFTGSEKAAGDKKGNEFMLDEQIRQFLEDGFTPSMQTEFDNAQAQRDALGALYEEGLPTQKEANRVGNARGKIPGQLQKKLKAMGLAPKKAAQMARTLNAMAGEKILSTDPKTYSTFSIATARAAGQETEENPNLVKSAEGGVQPFTDKKIPVKEEKEVKKEYPKAKPLREGLKEPTQVIPSEQKIDRSDLVKPKDQKIASLEKQIERTKELAKKADTPKKKEAFEKRISSLESDLTSLKNRDKLRVYPPTKTANKPKPQTTKLSDSEKGKRLEAQIAKTQEKLDRAKSEAEKNTLRRQIKILTSKIDTELNKAASPAFVGREPKNKPVKRDMSERVELGNAPAQKLTKAQERASDAKALIDRLGAEMALVTKSVITDPKKEKEAFEALKAVKKKFKSLKNLDDAIRAHLVETKKAKGTFATGKTISSVLDLETLIRLSPSSFIGELEKAMDPTTGKIPNAQDIEDMALEAREQVESKKEVIESRIAEVDREIRSLEDGRSELQSASQKPEAGDTTIEAEIEELKEIRKRLVNNLQLIAPENLSLDWKDVSHPLLWYRIAEGKPGTDSRELLSEPQSLTFGMMADPTSYAARGISVYKTKQDADKDRPRNENSSLTPQEELWDFVTGGFDESIAPRGQFAPYGVAEDGVVRTLDNFKLILQAVKASAMFPKQRDIGSKSMGRARYAKNTKGGNEQARKGYPSGYTTDKGASYAAIIAERIREKKLTGTKKKGSEEKAYLSIDLVSNDPTIEEVLGLAMANGRTLELLGDPSDSMKDFDQAMFIIARENMKSEMVEREKAAGSKTQLSEDGTKTIDFSESTIDRPSFLDGKMLTAKSKAVKGGSTTSSVDDIFKGSRKGGVPTDIDQETDYAEQAGDPWPKVQGSATFSKTLAGIVSTKARIKFETDYINYVIENVQSAINGFKTSEAGVPGQSLEQREVENKSREVTKKVYRKDGSMDSEQAKILGMPLSDKKVKETFPKLTGKTPQVAFEEFDNFLNQAKDNPTYSKAFIDFLTARREVFLNSLVETKKGRDSLEEAIKSFDSSKEGAARVALLEEIAEGGDVVLANKRIIKGFDIKPESEYNYRRPLERTSETVSAKAGRDSFTASKIYETFDVMTAFAAGRTLDGKDFEKEQTNIGKSETMPDRPIEVSKEESDLLSSVDINAVDFANWYLKSGKPEDQMRALQFLPSSQTSKDGSTIQQLPGGLGEGLLPYVFMDFARSMYEKLGIKSFDTNVENARKESGKNQKRFRKFSEVKKNLPAFKKVEKQKKELEKAYDSAKTADEKAVLKDGIDNMDKELQSMRLDQAPQDSNFQWNFERGQLLFNGKLASFDAFLDKEKRLDPAAMAALGKPIVQAVLDAEAIDVYRQTDPNAENLLQRDTQKGGAREDNSADMRDDTGNEDTQVAKAPKGQLDSGMSQFDSTFIKKSDIKMRDDLQKLAMAEFKENPEILERLSYEQLSELLKEDMGPVTEVLQKEVEKRALRKDISITFSPEGTSKILNSDAKILTSDADPNLAKATLLGRIAGDSELIKEFKEWAGGKKQSLSKGSLKMDLVDRADPLNQLNKLFLKGFEAVGLDSSNPLYKALNVHGKYYQFFGEGDNSVEQARLEYYEPMMELMREYNVDEKKIGEYLNARAAPSRNLQIEAKALEALKEMEKDPEGPRSEKYKKIEKFFFNTTEDGKRTIKRDSGISTETALKVVAEMEKEPRFVEFLDKFLIKYYKMNKEGLTTLASTGMIGQDTVSKEGINEVEAMRKAMSRFDFKGGKADKYGNKYKSKVSALEDNYSYSPLQGFEGETENFYEQEAAWEEFGAGSNATGKGFDQKKSDLILQGAFGRYKSGAPDPSLTLGNSFRQHISSAILAQKNTVAQKFGMVYGMMRAVIYDKDGNEHFNANRLTEEEKNDPIYQAYEELIKLKEPGNETAFKNLKSEFDQIFDPKGFEESETVTQYELQETGEIGIVRREMSQKFKNDPTAFTYRRNGIPQFIKFTSKSEGLRMADTMKNLRYENLPQILQGFNTVTRGMAQMFTSANPAFILPNFFRDVATAAIHLGEDDKKVLIKDALNFKNLSGFMKEIYKVEQKIHKGINPNTKDKEIMNLLASGDPKKILASGNRQAMFQYFKEAGGKVGYFRHESLPEKIKQIQKDLKGKKGWTKKGWKGMWQTIDSMNTAVENSIRASTFWAAIKDGRSTDEAAHISRNVTVDFNQKGNLTQTFGALYVFFGASVNSMHRFYRTLSRRTPAQRAALIGGMASAALIVNLFNRLMDDDEDEEIPDYDTISTYKRDTNFILPVPAGLPDFFNDEKDTGYFSLPLPLGYNLFWTMGQVMGDMVAKNVFNRGGMGFFGSATRVQESFLNAFNPVGGASLITAAFPTAVTPLVELYANKNFMNKPIRYADRPFEVPKPAHMQDPRSTPDHWTKLSRSINEFMGGSDDVKGSLAGMMGKNPLYYNSDEDIEFDISGNQMKHLLYGYLGGPGQIADTLFGGMFSAAKGDLSVKNIGDIPVANRFMRATTYGSATRNSFLNLRDATKNAEKVIKSAKILGPKVYTTALNDNKKLLQLSSQISAFDKQKNKMRRLKKQIESSKALSDNQKTQRVDELQKKELTLMIAVIKKAQALGIS